MSNSSDKRGSMNTPPQQQAVMRSDCAECNESAPDVVIGRLLGRVAQLEELLYQHELHEGLQPSEGV